MIERDITIEELVDELPEAVSYLMERDIVCIACGAPIWGTFEEAARKEGYDDAAIDAMVAELNALRDAGA
jgi:iron-sulfur cluster repair protein YtfE (RIC family)